MDKIKVVHVYEKLDFGGIENAILSMTDNKFCDAVILTQKKGENEEIFLSHGYKIERIPYTSKKTYRSEIRSFFEKNKVDVVHVHMHEYGVGTVIDEAKRAGIDCRIIHTHCGRTKNPVLAGMHSIMILPRIKNATDFISCSEICTYWNFFFFKSKAEVIYNGVDYKKFTYNEQSRIDYRKKHSIEDDKVVISFLGRLSKEKNPLFAVKLAEKLDEKYLIVIAGEGQERSNIEKYIYENNIKNVLLVGYETEPDCLLCASDFLILPSLYEGMPNVAIEAQATGLKCLVSDTITPEVNFGNGLYTLLPLSDIDEWKNQVQKQNTYTDRNIKRNDIFSSEYECEKIVSVYRNKLEISGE